MQSRKSGILLHPTSLPFTPGIGTIGRTAFAFADWLEKAGIGLWQVLPLGPTGYGDSPYQSFSSFALNPLLIDFDDLVADGYASRADMRTPPYIRKAGNVDYGAVVYWKNAALRVAARKFVEAITNPMEQGVKGFSDKKVAFYLFCQENKFWLRDYAAFMSIKSHYDEMAQAEGVPGTWNTYWEKSLAGHEKQAVDAWIDSHPEDFLMHEAIQFFASVQWNRLKAYANGKGIQIIGDVPIFVAPDSADVWSNQKFFQLNSDRGFSSVAGVPPDYFSAIGQLWGNPLYDWNALEADGYSWWIERVRRMLKLVDFVRIDHFRAFESYWAVPAGSANAINGKWEKGPGIKFFDALKKALGELPLIAEDLGIITDEVASLRDSCGLPGMKVLQFAFSKDEKKAGALVNSFLPHNFLTKNCVAYTGTHDNDTTQGFLNSMSEDFVALVASYVEGRAVGEKEALRLCDTGKLTESLVREAFASIADFAVVPLQDVWAVGSEGRMNLPSTSGANWAWRAERKFFEGKRAEEKAAWLHEMGELYARK